MIHINQKRVTSLSSHIPNEMLGQNLLVAVNASAYTENVVTRMGLPYPLCAGDKVLPSVIGRVSKFNANGKEVAQKHLPKETLYRDMEFTRTEWHGRDRVEKTDTVWIPYQRYPRIFIKPPAVEFLVICNQAGQSFITANEIIYNDESVDLLKHTINLFLEAFGECTIFTGNIDNVTTYQVRRLNWDILPAGQHPWSTILESINRNRAAQSPKSNAAALHRFKHINSLEPDFHAVGQGGYKGYVVFGFTQRGIYVFESQYVNNATYVFGGDWQELSQLSKAEIIDGDLHIARIVHLPSWRADLNQVLST